MQLVVSLNPAVDVEWRVETVRWEEKNQVLTERRWPGGKGINVARWLAHQGLRARSFATAFGDDRADDDAAAQPPRENSAARA